MVVLSGSNSRLLAEQLADSLGWEHHQLETRRFPDSEGYIRIPSETIEAVRSEPVVLVSNLIYSSSPISLIETYDGSESTLSKVRESTTSSSRSRVLEKAFIGIRI